MNDTFLTQLSHAISTSDFVLAIHCAPHWFPAGSWYDISQLEQQIAAQQLSAVNRGKVLVRVSPYDLPDGAGDPFSGRLAEWHAVTSLTAKLRAPMSIVLHLSTSRPYPSDEVLVGGSARNFLTDHRVNLIPAPEVDWLSQGSRQQDPYWSGDDD